MWQTKHLKFTDEAAAIAALSEAYPAEEGYQAASHTHAVDVVGLIVDEPATEETEATYVDGWHVNIAVQNTELPTSLAEFLIDVNSPSREFSGI